MRRMQAVVLNLLVLPLLLAAILPLFPGGAIPAAQAARVPGQNYPDLQLEPNFPRLPENVEVLRLENGLQVILLRNPSQPMVGIYTQIKTGSAWESYTTSGMTHMLEHLLFNGSDKYTQEQQYEIADLAGAYNNANTSDFYTNFMMVLPSGRLETGLDLQSQMLLYSTLPVDKFEKEKGIVLGEIVQGRDRPGHYTDEAIRQAEYGESSLALPTLGTKSTIEHMDRDQVYAFYRKWYVPNNMTLTLAGNFDRGQAVAWLEEYYGPAAPGILDRENRRLLGPIERTEAVTRRAGDRRVVALSFEAPTYDMRDYFPFLVMTELLGMDGSGILTRALDSLAAEERPQLGIDWSQVPGFGRLNLEFELPDGADPKRCYAILQDAVVGAVEMGIQDYDIQGIVRMSETNTLLEREQLRMTGIYIAEAVALGGVDFFVSYLEKLREVTAEDVTRVLTNWLVDAPCRAVLVEPAAAGTDGSQESGMATGMPPGMPPGMKMPAGMQMPPAMAAAMGQGGTAGSPAAGGSGAPAEGSRGETMPAAALQVDRSVLENGAVLVSQTNPGSPLMAIHLAVRGRAMIDRETGGAGALDLVHRMLNEGFAGCDKICLARRLRELGAVVKLVDDPRIPMDNYYTNGRFSFIRVETAAESGMQVLDLLTEMIQHGAFDGEDLDRILQERIVELEREQNSARRQAADLLDGALYGDHPLVLAPEGTTETLAEMDFNRMRLVYRRAFSPENLVFSVVGPYGHKELSDHIEGLLVGRGKPAPGLPPIPITTEPQSLTATLGGDLAAIRLGSIFAVDRRDTEALKLLTSILSDRMAMDLREARGLSYSVGASISIHGDAARFGAWLNPPHERRDEGLEALKAAIAGFDATTITQSELDKIRSAGTGRTMMRRLSSMGQAYYLAMAELDGDIPGYLEAFTAPEAVTLADLAAAAKYLKGMKLVEVVVD